MDWEYTLLSTPPEKWIVEQVIVLDWYDGPRAGLCALADPSAEFLFEMVDEQFDPDGLDLRICRLRAIPAGSVRQILTGLDALGPVKKPLWIPIWKFPNAEACERAEDLLQAVQSRARPTDLIISTQDMLHFIDCRREFADGQGASAPAKTLTDTK